MELEILIKLMIDALKLQSKSPLLLVIMIEKNYKKDLPNSKEELVLSKSEEPVKLKLEKLKTELPMPFALPELLSKKDLLLEEDAPYFMLL
jgi:hypothetical protein